MTDSINYSVTVKDPDDEGNYEWMSIRAGKPCYFSNPLVISHGIVGLTNSGWASITSRTDAANTLITTIANANTYTDVQLNNLIQVHNSRYPVLVSTIAPLPLKIEYTSADAQQRIATYYECEITNITGADIENFSTRIDSNGVGYAVSIITKPIKRGETVRFEFNGILQGTTTQSLFLKLTCNTTDGATCKVSNLKFYTSV